MSRFPCTACGACCRNAVKLGLILAADDGINCYWQRQEPGGPSICTIYEVRPAACRIAPQRPKGMSERCWYKAVIGGCCDLIKREGLDCSWVPRL
jgi:Fe-S-cluster containining protein